jgi:hypothetical protein
VDELGDQQAFGLLVAHDAFGLAPHERDLALGASQRARDSVAVRRLDLGTPVGIARGPQCGHRLRWRHHQLDSRRAGPVRAGRAQRLHRDRVAPVHDCAQITAIHGAIRRQPKIAQHLLRSIPAARHHPVPVGLAIAGVVITPRGRRGQVLRVGRGAVARDLMRRLHPRSNVALTRRDVNGYVLCEKLTYTTKHSPLRSFGSVAVDAPPPPPHHPADPSRRDDRAVRVLAPTSPAAKIGKRLPPPAHRALDTSVRTDRQPPAAGRPPASLIGPCRVRFLEPLRVVTGASGAGAKELARSCHPKIREGSSPTRSAGGVRCHRRVPD